MEDAKVTKHYMHSDVSLVRDSLLSVTIRATDKQANILFSHVGLIT